MSVPRMQPAHTPTLLYAAGAALVALLIYHFCVHHGRS